MTPREINKHLIKEDLQRKLEIIHSFQKEIKKKEEELTIMRDALEEARDLYSQQMSDALRMFSK